MKSKNKRLIVKYRERVNKLLIQAQNAPHQRKYDECYTEILTLEGVISDLKQRVKVNCPLFVVMHMLAKRKNLKRNIMEIIDVTEEAIKYAKKLHGEEYDNPTFKRDIQETIIDFKAGWRRLLEVLNSSEKTSV